VEGGGGFVGEFDCRSQKHLTRGTPTMRKDKQEAGIGLPETGVSLDELVRRGARQVIQQVIELDYVRVESRHASMLELTSRLVYGRSEA
jgi:hypothetical protein